MNIEDRASVPFAKGRSGRMWVGVKGGCVRSEEYDGGKRNETGRVG